MEHTKIEVAAVEETVAIASDVEIRDLNDLQLALVGGGIGEIVAG